MGEGTVVLLLDVLAGSLYQVVSLEGKGIAVLLLDVLSDVCM